MSKRPLTRRVRLCYLAAAGLQHYGAAGTTGAAAVDDDLDIVSLGAMQPPLTNQAQPSGFGLAGRPRPAETSFGEEESPDQTLSRLLQHTFGALGSALDDSKLDPNIPPAVDGIDGAALTRERSVGDAPSRVVLGEDEGQQPASLGAAVVEKLADVVEAKPKEEEEEEEEEGVEEGREEEEKKEKEQEEEEEAEEEEGSGQGTMSLDTGVASELGSQQEGAVSTNSHSGQGSEVGDAVNGSGIDVAVVAVIAEHDVDAGIAGEGADDAVEAAVALEGVSEAGAVLDAVPAPVRSVDSPPEPGIREASGSGLVEEEEVGDAPTGATASGGVEASGEGWLGQHLEGGTTASEDVEAFGEKGLGQQLEGGMASSGGVEAFSEGGLGQQLEGGTTTSEVAEAFGEGGLGHDSEAATTTPGEVAEAVSEGGEKNEIGKNGPVVPDDALVVEDGGLALTPDGTDPTQLSPVEDTGATGGVATSGDAAGTDALAGGGGGADNDAGAAKGSAGIDDAIDVSAGEAGLEVPERGVEVGEAEVPDGAGLDGDLSQEVMIAPPEIDAQVGASEAEAAAPTSDDVQESDAIEGNAAGTPVLPDVATIGVVEGSEAGDRSEPHGLVADVPLDLPLADMENAGAETTGESQEHSTTEVGTVGGADSGEVLTGDAEDDDTSRVGSSDAPSGSSAEGGGAGGQEAVGHRRGAEAVEASEPAKGGGLPEAGTAAVDTEADGARGGGVGEVAGSPLEGFGESVGSASGPSETDASPEDRLRPGDAPAGEAKVIDDATRDPSDISEAPPASSEGGDDKAAGMGSEGGGEDQSPRERRVFRFSEPPWSRAAGESAGLPGMPGDASSGGAKKFTMPPIKPIDVSPDALQKFRVPEDSPGEAGIEGTEVWSDWGKRWAGVAMEAAVQVAKVAGGRGGMAASSGLQFCKARMMKVWREVVEPRTEHVRLRLEAAAVAGLDEVGEHLADPMLAEAI